MNLRDVLCILAFVRRTKQKSTTPEGSGPTLSDSGEAVSVAGPEGALKEPEGKTRPKEIGGPQGPEPTRYGDWERNGRCSDF